MDSLQTTCLAWMDKFQEQLTDLCVQTHL